MVRGEVCGEWSKLEEEEEEEERRGKGKLGGTKKGKAGGRKGNNNYRIVKIAKFAKFVPTSSSLQCHTAPCVC